MLSVLACLVFRVSVQDSEAEAVEHPIHLMVQHCHSPPLPLSLVTQQLVCLQICRSLLLTLGDSVKQKGLSPYGIENERELLSSVELPLCG